MAKINWDNIGRMISDTADTMGKKTGGVVEITKLKNQIYNLERERKRNYEALGKKIYERYTNEGVIDTEFLAICEELAQQEILIDQYNGEIEERKKEI